MRTARCTILVASAMLIMGCQFNKKPKLPPPANASTVQRVQAEFRQVDPSAEVGLVAAVMPKDRLAAISDINTTEFHVGEPISFIDTDKNPIGHGTIIRITDNFLIVRVAETPRPLREGDMAMHVKP